MLLPFMKHGYVIYPKCLDRHKTFIYQIVQKVPIYNTDLVSALF